MRIPTHPNRQLRSVFPQSGQFHGLPRFHSSSLFLPLWSLVGFVTPTTSGVVWGAAVYLIYSVGSRKLIPRAHRRGIRLSQTQQFEDAIRAHKESYEFFTRHSWLDRYRSITMMSPSSMSYREMALINIAFAYGQIGNGEKAKEYYQRAQREFPDSGMAIAALKMIESFGTTTRRNQKHQITKPCTPSTRSAVLKWKPYSRVPGDGHRYVAKSHDARPQPYQTHLSLEDL